MFGNRWQLFRLAGIPLYVDISWLVILALITWTLTTFFSFHLPGLPPSQYWMMGLATAVAFFICIVLHEMGHALVARANGTPVRGITLFMFGGVAEMGGEPARPWKEFTMAIAGPVVTAVLVVVFWGLARWTAETPIAYVMLEYLAQINLVVLIFNLVPAFPLDGGRVLRSVIWGATNNLRTATYWASLSGQAFAWLLIIFGVWRLFQGDFIGGIWLGLIGMFLRSVAQGSYQQVLLREALQGEPVRDFMNRDPIVVPPDLDVKHCVEDYVYRYHRKSFPVASNGHLEGFVTTRELAQLPREEWAQHTVGEVMRTDVENVSVSPDADALDALQKMQNSGLSRLLVTDKDRLVGIISLKDLMRMLNLRLELSGAGGS